MKARAAHKPPVQGAVRTYSLVDVTAVEDVVSAAMEKLAAKGWSPVDQDCKVLTTTTRWAEVMLWAVPPEREK